MFLWFDVIELSGLLQLHEGGLEGGLYPILAASD